ncbi:MAG: hypothetical protein H6823_15585 [Planctomycetaceae bacterium]|nr:hypothetical protein [Planctomycetaceae bacterium]
MNIFSPLPEFVMFRCCLFIAILLNLTNADSKAEFPNVAPPTAELVASFQLDTFYTKHVSVKGFPVLGSAKVSDVALQEAAYLIDQMLGGREDIYVALIDSKTRFAIMAPDEFTTEIPEHSDLTPKTFWDRRARGLGATPARPAVSCGEENLLCLRGDPYHEENILVHEFAHAIHDMGLARIDGKFDDRLQAIYDQAIQEGLWNGKYAANNHHEYWAEGVQSYFGTNRLPDHDHNHVDTRDKLKEYDPRLFALIDEVFRGNPWQYTRPEHRRELPHLRGWDAEDLPSFSWPEHLLREGAKQKRDREQAAIENE